MSLLYPEVSTSEPLHPLRDPRQRGSHPLHPAPQGVSPSYLGPPDKTLLPGSHLAPCVHGSPAHEPLPPQVRSSLNPASSHVASRGRCNTEPSPKHKARLPLLSDLLCLSPEPQPLETEGQPVLVTLNLGICHYTASGTQAQALWSQSSFRELLHWCQSRWLQGLQRRQAGSLPLGAPTT